MARSVRPATALAAAVVATVLAVAETSQLGPVAVAHGGPSPWLLTHAAALATMALCWRHLRPAWSPVLTAAAVLLGVQAASVVTAVEPGTAFGSTVRFAADLVTLAAVAALAAGTGAHRLVLGACTAAVASLAALAVVQEAVLHNGSDLGGVATVLRVLDAGARTVRHAGPVGDPNFWARVLVLFLPFAAAFALASVGGARRVAWAAATAALLAGVWLTQSRGGMLASFVAGAVLLTAAGPRYRRWLLAAPVVVAVVLAVPATGSRLATLLDSSGGEIEESLLLRARAQETAREMVADHPLLGVGAGVYGDVAPTFEQELDVRHVGRLTEGVAPHNFYLEAAAETGLLGLAAWLLFLGAVAVVSLRALLVTRPGPGEAPGVDHLLAAACLAALAGWMAASVFLHLAQFRTLLVVAGTAAALDLRTAGLRGRVPVRLGVPRRVVTTAIATVAAAVVVAAVAVAVASARGPAWRGEATVALGARHAGSLGAYEIELLSRPRVLPTLGAVVAGSAAGNGVTVRAEGTSASGVLRVVVEGDSRAGVDAALDDVTARGVAALNELDVPFRASAVGQPSVRRVGW